LVFTVVLEFQALDPLEVDDRRTVDAAELRRVELALELDEAAAQTGRDPVVCVSWKEAQAYASWLSHKTSHSYRLLSEAEWEYADRAGTDSPAYWGDDPNEACKYANGVDATLTERFPKGKWEDRVSCHDGFVFTAPVGSFKPNAFGLYDMEGNAFEWVEDCLSEITRGLQRRVPRAPRVSTATRV
jgi:formylglycine-generating enzyme required for sulfatase activity